MSSSGGSNRRIGDLDKFERLVPDKAYFKIGEVAKLLGVKPYVLRYWETEFPHIKPQKTTTGQRRYARDNVIRIAEVKHLLHEKGLKIQGVRNYLARKSTRGEPVQLTASAQAVRMFLLRTLEQVEGLLALVEEFAPPGEPSPDAPPEAPPVRTAKPGKKSR